MSNWFIEIGFNVLSSALLLILVLSSGEHRRNRRQTMVLAVIFGVAYATCVSIFNVLTLFDGYLGAMAYVTLAAVFSIVLVRCSWWRRLFLCTGWVVILIGASVLTLNLFTWIRGDNAIAMMSATYSGRIYILVVGFLIKLAFGAVFVMLNRKQLVSLSALDGTMLSLFFLVIATIVLVLLTHAVTYMEENQINVPAVLFVALVAIGLIVLWRISVLSATNRRQERMIELIQENELQDVEISELKRRVAVMQHDMKKYVHVATSMIEKGEAEEAAAYLKQLSADGQQLAEQVAFSGNSLVDAILNRTGAGLREKQVTFQVSCRDLKQSVIEERDLCILLANLLDNAAEAVMTCEGEKRVRVEIACGEKMQSICISNTVPEPVLPNNPYLKTTKADKEHHGWGLKSVQGIVKKYNGVMHCKDEDGWFVCEILCTKE